MRRVLFNTPLLARFLVLLSAFSTSAVLAQNTVVSEGDIARQPENTPPTKEWVAYERNGGSLLFVDGPGDPPLGCGSVQLTTPTSADKAYLFNYGYVGSRLSDVTAIGYSTYRSAGTNQQVAGLNIEIDYNGPDASGGYAVLVFEPVYNTDQGTVTSNVWQSWDALNGGEARWWSSRDIPGVCAFSCFVKWSDILAANPDATIVGGVGINQGSGNPALISSVDAFTFNTSAKTATYNFEPSADSDGDGQGDSCDEDDDNDGVPDWYDCDPYDPHNTKFLICHKGKTLCVDQQGWENGHKKHGDQLGPCSSSPVTRSSIQPLQGQLRSDQFTLASSPNPFRGITRFEYNVPVDSRVVIKLFDLLGRELRTVVDAQLKAGSYSASLDGSQLHTGVYYARMVSTADGKTIIQTQKLVRTE